jgi:plastocyanin
MQRRLLFLLVAGLLGVGLAACSSSGNKSSTSTSGPSASTADVTINNYTFASKPVKAGATVTVDNQQSGVTHTVTSDDGTSFNVSVNGGSTATFTAPTKPGTYKFHCNIHTYMHGTLTVTA